MQIHKIHNEDNKKKLKLYESIHNQSRKPIIRERKKKMNKSSQKNKNENSDEVRSSDKPLGCGGRAALASITDSLWLSLKILSGFAFRPLISLSLSLSVVCDLLLSQEPKRKPFFFFFGHKRKLSNRRNLAQRSYFL